MRETCCQGIPAIWVHLRPQKILFFWLADKSGDLKHETCVPPAPMSCQATAKHESGDRQLSIVICRLPLFTPYFAGVQRLQFSRLDMQGRRPLNASRTADLFHT